MVVTNPKATPPPPKPVVNPQPEPVQPQSGPSTNPIPDFNNNSNNNNPFGGLPNFGGMGGFPGMPDPQTMESMMNSPEYQQMMDELLSNPEQLRSLMQMNPMIANNPMMRQGMDMLLQNPEMFRQAFQQMGGTGGLANMMNNPVYRQQMEGMLNPNQNQQNPQNPFGSLFGNPSTQFNQPQPPVNNDKSIFLQMTQLSDSTQLSSSEGQRGMKMFLDSVQILRNAGVNIFPNINYPQPQVQSNPQPQQTSNQNPKDRFRIQLQQMNDMGLLDDEKNIRALLASNGNVNVAIEKIFSGNIQ